MFEVSGAVRGGQGMTQEKCKTSLLPSRVAHACARMYTHTCACMGTHTKPLHNRTRENVTTFPKSRSDSEIQRRNQSGSQKSLRRTGNLNWDLASVRIFSLVHSPVPSYVPAPLGARHWKDDGEQARYGTHPHGAY